MIGGRWIDRGFLNPDTPSLHGRALARSLPICYRVTWKKGPSDSYARAVAAAATISIYAKRSSVGNIVVPLFLVLAVLTYCILSLILPILMRVKSYISFHKRNENNGILKWGIICSHHHKKFRTNHIQKINQRLDAVLS
jgi:hypothetical protein